MNELIKRRGYRPKILLVDDQPVNIHVLRELFKNECEVFMATDGEQAIAICQATMPDLILLDVAMPGMDGLEVCRQLKASEGTSDIPIIFVTAYNNDQDQLHAFEVGAVDVIGKPFNSVVVLARVRAHLMIKLQTDILKSIAFVDGLTGVANRRRFDEESIKLWQHASRSKLPISLLMIDVDFFKLFNDYYGHSKGDVCLMSVAQSLRETLKRPLDLVARYGGEEFVCVLPDTDFTGLKSIGEEMLNNVRSLSIPHLMSKLESKIVSISIGGITVIPTSNDALMGGIEAADKQLYLAKTSGRAQLCAVDCQS